MKDTKKSAKSTAARFTDENEPPSARGARKPTSGEAAAES
jgi:hypothetical protein